MSAISISSLRLFICSIMLNVFLLMLPVSISFGSNHNGLLANASAALDDELYKIAEQNIRQYLAATADVNQLQTKYIVILARALHGQKHYPEMLTLLEQGKIEHPPGLLSDDYSFWLALAYYKNMQLSKALQQISNFKKSYPGSPLGRDITRLQVKTLLKLGRNTEAIKILERLIRANKDDNETVNDRLFLGQILADLGRTNESSTILEKLLPWSPDTSAGQKCRAILGKVYMHQRQWQKARQVFEPLINQDNIPDNFRLQAIVSLSDIAVFQTNFSEALSIIENRTHLITKPSYLFELNLHKGVILLEMNKLDEGTVLIHDYVGTQTNKAIGAKVQLKLAQDLLTGNLNERALVEFEIFLESFASQTDLIEAFNGKGTALFNLGRYHEAAASFTKADETCKNPEEKAQYRYRTADSLFALSQFKPAAEKYAKVVGMLPGSNLAMMALFQSAECQAKMHNFSEAETIFWKIYDADPSDFLAPRALLRIAEIMLQRNKLLAAETIYSWINHDYTGQWQARSIFGRGMIAYRAGRFADARKYFKETLRLAKLAGLPPRAPDTPWQPQTIKGEGIDDDIAADTAYMSAWTSFMLNKNIDARSLFSEVVHSYPHSSKAPEALFWLGEDDYNNRKYQSAETFFRHLITDYPKSALADDALFWSGRCALQQNDFRRGRNYFSSLIKNYPSSSMRPEARYFQGIALCELGQFDAAILIFNEIIKQYPEHDLMELATFKKADCQFILGSNEPKRYEEAVNSYQIILDQPDYSAVAHMQAKYKIGRCLEKLGKANEAIARYLEVVYSYLQNQDQTPSGNLWFTRAAFHAAGIMEDQQHWRKAVNIYERVVDANIPASHDAQERIAKLRSEHWLFFY